MPTFSPQTTVYNPVRGGRSPLLGNQLDNTRGNGLETPRSARYGYGGLEIPKRPVYETPKPPPKADAAATIGAARTLATGTSALSAGVAVAAAIAINLLTPEPTADEDEILRRKREEEQLQPSEPPQEIQPAKYSYIPGQSNVYYNVNVSWTISAFGTSYPNQTSGDRSYLGAIGKVRIVKDANNADVVQINITNGQEWVNVYNSGSSIYPLSDAKIVSIVRSDGLPDTQGKPITDQEPINSKPAKILQDPNNLNRSVGDRPSPPPAYEFKFPQDLKIPTFNPDSIRPTEIPDFNPLSDPQTLPPTPQKSPQPTPTQTPQPQPFPTPDQSTDTAPPTPAIETPPNLLVAPPTILYGPSSDPGSIKFGDPQRTPTPLPQPTPNSDRVREFQPHPLTRSPELKPTELKPPAKTPTPEPTDLDKIKNFFNDVVNPIGLGVVGISALVKPIFENTTKEALETAAANGTCRTTQPGGCSRKMMDDAADRINQNTNNRLNNLLDGLGLGADGFLMQKLNGMDLKLGNQIPGGISGKLGRLSSWLRLDRALNFLTYAAVLHNAWMLSSSFVQTLTAATNSFIKAFVLSDDEGETFDIGAIINKQIEDVAKSIFGAETVTYWETQYKKYVRVYQAAANLLSNITSIGYSILSVLEIVGSRISKIGNALRWYGVVEETAYGAMNEVDNFQIPLLNRIQRLEEAASTIDNVSSEVTNVRQNYLELKSNKAELEKSLKDATTTYANNEKKERDSIKNPEPDEDDI